MPEVPSTVDMTTGKLGLTDKEEDQIVAFPADTDGWIYNSVSKQRCLHGSLHEGWYGRNSR